MISDKMEKKNKTKRKIRTPRGVQIGDSTIIEDVLIDPLEMEMPRFVVDYEKYLNHMWEANPDLYKILKKGKDLEEVRNRIFTYLDKCERRLLDPHSDLHILEKATVREGIRVFRDIIGLVNERRVGVSALHCLWKLATNQKEELKWEVSVGFVLEFLHLFRAIAGISNIYRDYQLKKGEVPDFLRLSGREAAAKREEELDDMAAGVKKYFRKYPSGLEDDTISWRVVNMRRILKYFGGTLNEWNDYRWHLTHVIKDLTVLSDLIELTEEQIKAIKLASQKKIPLGITPYYLSLIDRRISVGHDRAIRAQVIPPVEYVKKMAENKKKRRYSHDFMGEQDTSPIDLVTRRYPMIAILKPYNTCAQICVYCQRNWEISECLAPDARSTAKELKAAISWFDRHKGVGEVLITGGDPMLMEDEEIDYILRELSGKKHIYRIRIGTRTPVVLPMRWTNKIADILANYHLPGRREICVVTHFIHSYEITPDAMKAIQKIRMRGMAVYNQQVFTTFNSRRFETAKLRHDLRLIGVDPYYIFNMKGKEETRQYMVPIARILQERCEEARLLPGLSRTDESVFNVPRLGKNELHAWQDHRLVMILPNGSRVYTFHPWEKNIAIRLPYNYTDVPIYDYLQELAARGENLRQYRTIWFYY